jgi:hypothetical protein
MLEIEDKANRLEGRPLPFGFMTAGGAFKRPSPIRDTEAVRQYGILVPRTQPLRLRVETRAAVRDQRGQLLPPIVDLEPLLERSPGLPTRLRLFLD